MRATKPRLVFTLCVLLGINAMNFYDRQVLAAVQEKIRTAWDLSDKELGWLSRRSFCSTPWSACRWAAWRMWGGDVGSLPGALLSGAC
jgi:hypothetical protein